MADTVASIKLGEWLKLKHAIKCAYDMRRAQKLYYQSRDRKDLIDAKQLEKELDVRLEELGYHFGG